VDYGKVLINALTEQVGTSTRLFGYPTNQALSEADLKSPLSVAEKMARPGGLS
jgi:hypothetical protein